MITVNQMTKLLDISNTAVRQWTAEFADHLSPAASPEKGKPRRYSNDDYLIFTTIRVLRGQGKGFADIHLALTDGVRHEPLNAPQTEKDAAGQGDPGSALVVQLTAAAAQWQATANTLAEERDYLRSELKQAQDSFLSAETGRAAAEATLEVLEAQAAKSPGFWARVFGR